MNKTAFFIINQFSGAGRSDELKPQIIAQCKKSFIDPIIEFTKHRGHATELARHAVEKKMDYVFAVGGDGTVNEVAQGLVNSKVVLGILPKGSGNGLARHLGLSMSFKKSLQLLTRHQQLAMDTFLVNEKFSVNVSGIGFDGHIANLFADKTRRGLSGYVKLVLQEFRAFKSFEASIEMNGKKVQHKSFVIALANASQFGNNAKIAPHASVCDELIDVCVIEKVPMLRAASFVSRMFLGNVDKSRYVKITKTDQVTIRLNKAMAFHIDGEAMLPTDHFDIVVKPASLLVLIPAN